MTDRTALVAGGGGGIGSAICRRLASDGLVVLVGYHASADRAEALAAELPGDGHRAVQVAVEDSTALAALAADVAASEGRLDVLVNCAGVTRPVAHDDLDGLDDELIDQIFATNWRGPFATIRAFRGMLEASDDAVVVNISSVAGLTGQGSNVAYCASKAALDSMTRSLGRALAPTIRIMSVSPGWVLGEYASRMPDEVIAVQRDATPLNRLATGEDVGAAVSAVVHDLPFTTGTIVNVDGGRPLGVA
ncbi:MAG: SDR family oxidoreductase [Actinomycetota bacterium]